ncbi:unnamed protein product [Spirodela intermedia]|uniref:DUF676 domain-containing protein n=1 Tax=Spirodela intermedia TaxID=51605 RepID=A0A7I8IIH5_SPIIN|nr:unnamed protein product [Spirodela intermedia]CAA6657652.1 unnamed protein product [Spirodela intermedia]
MGRERIKNKGGLKNHIRRRLVCFCGGAAGEHREAVGGGIPQMGGGEIDRAPTHLVIMVNGIIGSAQNWRFAEKQFLKRLPQDVTVHRSRCNGNLLTLDGVDVMGTRLAEEVLSIVKQGPKLQKISFVGHSLGGLIARYAIAKLYEPGLPQKPSEEDGSHEDSDKGSEGKIAGLEPMNFVTFCNTACRIKIPMLCGVRLLEKTARRSSRILGRTGRHLFLDDNDMGRPPLLVQMVKDSDDLHFISALRSFRRLVAYSNVRFDHIVGWNTSSIRHQDERPKLKAHTKISGYRHIVRVEPPKAVNIEQDASLDFDMKTNELQEAMIDSLNKVPWERVDVSFHKTIQRFMAHETIQVKTRCLNSAGADVISHMIDNFLL